MEAIRSICEPSLWDTLRVEKRSIVLYGTGNGADKILDRLAERSVPVAGVFASEGFVRSRTFRGMPVEAEEALLARLGGEPVVLLAFGSARPEVLSHIRALDARVPLRIPDVPLFGGALFDRAYFEAHLPELEAVDALLADDLSRALLRDIIRYRLTGELRFLRLTESPEQSLRALLPVDRIRCALDGGAFTGDTARLLANACPHLQTVLAVEPDERSFRRLSAYAGTETRCHVVPVCRTLWEKTAALPFVEAGSRASALASPAHRTRTAQRECATVDELCAAHAPELLKLDVEGAEEAALRGASETLARCRPSLCISLYHRTDDLYRLPLFLTSRCPGYRFYLRRPDCVPAWDLTLYAVSPS